MIDRREIKFPSTFLPFAEKFITAEFGKDAYRNYLDFMKISPDQLDASGGYAVDGEQFYASLKLLQKLCGDEPVVIKVLKHAKVHDMGFPGLAGFTAENVAEVIKLIVQFNPLMMPALNLTFVEELNSCRLEATMNCDLEEQSSTLGN